MSGQVRQIAIQRIGPLLEVVDDDPSPGRDGVGEDVGEPGGHRRATGGRGSGRGALGRRGGPIRRLAPAGEGPKGHQQAQPLVSRAPHAHHYMMAGPGRKPVQPVAADRRTIYDDPNGG